MIKKVITFDPTTEECSFSKSNPLPSIKFIPDWYKKLPQFVKGEKKLKFPLNQEGLNITLKKCVPFLDAMTYGYMAYLEDDIYVEQVNNEPFIRWRTSEKLVSWHHSDQAIGVPIPEHYYHVIGKWGNDWGIKVSKGYSVLFSHPSNRIDLPFYTFSGLVNVDDYNVPVQFPFLLKKGFEGIISSKTPICQLFMIKNDSWKSNIENYNKKRTFINDKFFRSTFVKSYKKNFWKRQSYE
jgi:hypothetical protein